MGPFLAEHGYAVFSIDYRLMRDGENRYPAAHFADANFNQLVIKAFFTGVAVDRIVGLERRKSDELRRMAADYASERRAAGRAVPNDLDLVLS